MSRTADIQRGLVDEWSEWRDGPADRVLGVREVAPGFQFRAFGPPEMRERHRWQRYRHESDLLAMMATGGIACTLVARPGPTRPMEGA